MHQQEEVNRHLLILLEAGKAFDASQKAMQIASTLPLDQEDRQEVIRAHWRRGKQAESQYNAAVNWLDQHNIPYTFSQELSQYVQLVTSTT